MKRLFAAIKIHPSHSYVSLFDDLTSSLRHERIKWVEPANMHLTLKFFGETDEKQIPLIKLAIERAVLSIEPFILQISNIGIFGSRYDPKIIWFGIKKHPELDLLAKNIFTELNKQGWEPDRQNFVPHLTIGRIKEIKDKQLFQQIIGKYAAVDIQEENVNEITLYESVLRREGPLYLNVFSTKL
jgi:RNA 2',3'-cyclic 3'-phosphodiesterase